ncbi:COBW domain-containing protein 1 [Striga asiatica]|uniref:COBW domain-containing protein 1 n=1 Tax=Striga asiatica TaxID=4170 RepID=A0A5A7PSF7_STRAF|nr:COBW domain-containing protein 1 [Striga asiatica]
MVSRNRIPIIHSNKHSHPDSRRGAHNSNRTSFRNLDPAQTRILTRHHQSPHLHNVAPFPGPTIQLRQQHISRAIFSINFQNPSSCINPSLNILVLNARTQNAPPQFQILVREG